MIRTFLLILLCAGAACAQGAMTSGAANDPTARYEYRVLATNKTGTLERELNENAAAGFRFEGVMGGDTSFGGSESVAVMSRRAGEGPRYEYKLLATNKTGTMQKEMNDAGKTGFDYRGQTVYESTFGGREVVVILERRAGGDNPSIEYKLLATSKTSTMQKELAEPGEQGFSFAGMTVAKTTFGGSELVTILRRRKSG